MLLQQVHGGIPFHITANQHEPLWIGQERDLPSLHPQDHQAEVLFQLHWVYVLVKRVWRETVCLTRMVLLEEERRMLPEMSAGRQVVWVCQQSPPMVDGCDLRRLKVSSESIIKRESTSGWSRPL
jgi:hypothetical protein